MKTVRPSDEQLAAFVKGEHDGKPVVMLNMLKFRELADYPAEYLAENPQSANCTGQEAYEAYSKQTTPFLLSVGGRPLWVGKVNTSLIGPDDEHWDRIFLVYYPSRDALKKMLAMPAYRAIGFHRTAALEDSRLVETKEVSIPKTMLMILSIVFRIKSFFSRS